MISSPSAFARLSALLADIAPPRGLAPIQLHLGECRVALPATFFSAVADIDGWTRYPPLGGTPELRLAYTRWLGRRFGVHRSIAAQTIALEPTPGTKQALGATLGLAVVRAQARGIHEPTVVLPNPYYPTYEAGTRAAGARAVFYTTVAGTGTGTLLSAVDTAADRIAAIVVCSPGSPRGEILSAAVLREVAHVAAATDAILILDECYIDVCCGPEPPSFLSIVDADGGSRGAFVVLHSLSKRSGAPGLRSGFAAGDPETVALYADYNRACGVATPRPVCDVAASLWNDDAHVSQLRSTLARNWNMADVMIGSVPGYCRSDGGCFVWIPLSGDDDEVAAQRLWAHHGLSVMPGRYLASADARGSNPGAGHLRIALVHDEVPMREALLRLREALGTASAGSGHTGRYLSSGV